MIKKKMIFKKLKSLNKRFNYDDKELSFFDHLEDLRKTIIRMFFAFAIGVVIFIPFNNFAIDLLLKPISLFSQDFGINLEGKKPTSAFQIKMMVIFFGGFLISLPAMIFFLASFVLPGVKENEQKILKRVFFSSILLFILGVLLAYTIVLPLAINFLAKQGLSINMSNEWLYSDSLVFVLQILLAFGLFFQLPIIILALGKIGLVGSSSLRKKRRHVIIGLLTVSMFITPPDIYSQVLLAIPLFLLYEICIWILHVGGKRDPSSKKNNDC